MRSFRTFITWSLVGHLVGLLIFMVGCGSNASSPVATGVSESPAAWTTSLAQIQQSLQTATGTAWTAGETSVSLGFSQEEAAALCGLIADPVLSTFSASLRGSIGFSASSGLSASAQSLPRRFSWQEKDGRNWASPVKSQGRYGTCVAFAAIAALEIGMKIARNEATATIDLSEWHLWYNGTGGKNPSPGGWFPSGAVEQLKKNGVVSEELCPYSGIPAIPLPPGDAKAYAVSDWSVVAGHETVKQALLEGPVLASMRVQSDFCYYKGGVYSPVAGQELGDHAILLIGYDDDQECWIGQNSWSASWGENGFFRIKYGQINDIGLRLVCAANSNAPAGTATTTGSTPSATDSPATVGTLGFPDPIVRLGPYVREVTATSAMVCWATDQSTTSEVEYGSGLSFSRVANSTTPAATHSMKLADLAENTSYSVRVSSKTTSGQTITSNVLSFVTLSITSSTPVLPIIYDVSVSKITRDSATVNWKTDIPAAGKTYYSSIIGASTSSDLRLLNTHSITLNNLTGGTTYSFYVEASASSLIAVSETGLFTTLDNTPPVISQVSVPAGTLTGKVANIVWLTDELSTSQVEYGLTAAYGYVTSLNPTLTYGHLVSLAGLLPQTTYHYRVRSKDANGNESSSVDGTFTTPDSVAPVLSTIRASPITGTTATINFTTNETATVQIEYGSGAYTAITAPDTNTSFAIVLAGLTPRLLYKYRVRAKDATGNETVSAELTFTTVDSSSPGISNVSVPAATLTGTTADVTWLTDEPATTQVEYGLTAAYGLSSAINTTRTNGHLVKLFNLLPNTLYHYRVVSKDVGGNEAFSGDNSFTTLDSQPPVLSGIRVLPITGTTANIIFTTSKAATAQVEYGVGTFNLVASTSVLATAHEVLLTGLSPKQSYRYRIRVRDSAGNEAVSAELSFATLDTIPPVITGITVTAVSNTSAVIGWTTNKLAYSSVLWGTTAAYGNGPVSDPTYKMLHSLKVTLDDSTNSIWHFQVSSTDSAGNIATSSDQTFAAPLLIYEVNVSAIGTSAATITWKSNATASSLVDYGVSSGYGNQAMIMPYPSTGTQNHSVSLSNLTPFTLYHFRVRSTDQTSREVMSRDFTFQTLDSGPPVISRVSARNLSNSSVLVSWTTDKLASAMVEYGTISGTYVSQVTSTSAWSTSQAVSLVGLQAGRTYYYRVTSVDASSNITTSPEATFVTSGTSAPLISVMQAVTMSDTTASITWTTDQPGSTQVEYATVGMSYTQTPLDTTLNTSHVVTLSNLSPYTQYRYRVRSRNLAGLETVSAEGGFLTPDQNPPQIYDLFVQSVTANAASLVWKTDENSDTQVEYGTQTYNLMSGLNTLKTKSHVVNLTGLQENASYVFRVKAKDSFNQVGSATGQFTTLDKTAPVLENINYSLLTATSVRITWTTAEAGTSLVDYGSSAAYGNQEPTLPYPLSLANNHQIDLANLSPQTTYNFRVRSTDAAGNEAWSRNFTFTTLDTIAPVISGIFATSVTATSAVIVWTTNENADSLLNYGPVLPYASAKADAVLTKTHSIAINNLTEKTLYHFAVTSVDGFANSSTSEDFSFTTLDRTPPVIAAATAAVILESGATITWTTDDEATSKIEYGFTTNYGYVMQVSTALTTGHSVTMNGLNPFTTYHYRVRSTNAAGYETISGDYSFTTQATLIIQNVVVNSYTLTDAKISWTTNSPALCEVVYGVASPPVLGPMVEDSTPWGTTHSITIPLTDVLFFLPYYFEVRARTGAGVTATSGIRSFVVN